MDSSNTWVVVSTDGDADYTDVYLAEGVSTPEEAAALENSLPGDYEIGLFFRVIPLQSLASLMANIAELEE